MNWRIDAGITYGRKFKENISSLEIEKQRYPPHCYSDKGEYRNYRFNSIDERNCIVPRLRFSDMGLNTLSFLAL